MSLFVKNYQMKNLRTAKAIAGSLIIAAFFSACRDGAMKAVDTTASPQKSSHTLSWDAPETTVNNETINPYNDLHHYELYVSSTASFSDTDTPMAFVSAVEEELGENGMISRKLITEFDLALLNLDDAYSTLYVSMRAVGVDGQKSDFMVPVTWTRS